jgi:hypothetical protein
VSRAEILVIAAGLAVLFAAPLAVLINRVDREIKFRRIVRAMEAGAARDRDIPVPFSRESNVTALARRRVSTAANDIGGNAA